MGVAAKARRRPLEAPSKMEVIVYLENLSQKLESHPLTANEMRNEDCVNLATVCDVLRGIPESSFASGAARRFFKMGAASIVADIYHDELFSTSQATAEEVARSVLAPYGIRSLADVRACIGNPSIICTAEKIFGLKTDDAL